MPPVVCIRNQPSAPLGIIEDILRERDIPYLYCDAWSRDAWPGPEDISALIVLGGEMNVDALDRHPFLRHARTLVRAAVDAGRPMLGVCLGAQILTRAMGAEVRPAPRREIGFLPIKATPAGMDDPVLAPFAPEMKVFQFHEDTCELPQRAELLMKGEDVPVQAFRIGRTAYGVQFHLEVTPEIIAAWCDEVPDLEDSWGRSKQAVLAEAKTHLREQQAASHEAIDAFLNLLG
jgi:GMP synthase (glutamine-hydrolysing)